MKHGILTGINCAQQCALMNVFCLRKKDDRISCQIRFASFGKRIPHLWNFIGATKSHEKTRKLALKEMTPKQTSALICEDDCEVEAKPEVVRSVLKEVKAWLSNRRQGWLTCQLGAQPCGQVTSKRKIVKQWKHGSLAETMQQTKQHIIALSV